MEVFQPIIFLQLSKACHVKFENTPGFYCYKNKDFFADPIFLAENIII